MGTSIVLYLSGLRFTNDERRATRLTSLRPQELSVAVDTSPIAIDEGHGVATDWTIRWRPFSKEWEKIRKLDIVFVHGSPILPAV